MDYDVKEIIGQGTYSIVFKVIRNDKVMAMKVLDFDIMEQEEINQVNMEIKILSIVDHPNIICLYDFFIDDNMVFIVTDYCPGGSLYDRILINRLDEKTVIKYIKQLVDAISYLHDNNIIHRDIKAENVLIDDDNIKLCDFGWSVISQSPQVMQCGTLEYFPIEIVLNEQYDQNVDLWNVGILSYELLTGVTPFSSDTEENTLNKIISLDYIFLNYMGDNAIDFIKSLLVRPEVRMSIYNTKNHPWLDIL